jgi:hypothetical protein
MDYVQHAAHVAGLKRKLAVLQRELLEASWNRSE